MNKNVNNGSQTLWSQEPFAFFQTMEATKELLFTQVIALNSYNIKNQNRWKYLFVNYLFTSHQKQYIKKKNSKKIEKSGSTLYFCTFVMSGLNEND